MRVFRVETVEGKGPYGHAWERPAGWCTDFMGSRHPGPDSDGPLADSWGSLPWDERGLYYFGFESMGQLSRWFYRDAHKTALAAAGFKVAEYEIPDCRVRRGHMQLVFKRCLAQLIQRHECEWDTAVEEELA